MNVTVVPSASGDRDVHVERDGPRNATDPDRERSGSVVDATVSGGGP